MNLFQIADNDLWNKIHSLYQAKGGVYKIIAFQNGQRVTINRFLGQDTSGTLYIGKANSFINRVIDLKKSIDPDYESSAHDFGKQYKFKPNIANQFPYEILFMELIESDKSAELEKVLILEYKEKFGEVTPLNALG